MVNFVKLKDLTINETCYGVKVSTLANGYRYRTYHGYSRGHAADLFLVWVNGKGRHSKGGETIISPQVAKDMVKDYGEIHLKDTGELVFMPKLKG